MNLPKRYSKNENVIIWAIDPSQDPSEAKNLIKELRTWARHLNCEIQPVSVFSKSVLSLTKKLPIPWEGNADKFAREAVGLYLKQTQCTEFLPPKIIFASTLSNRKMASVLAKHAESENALMIFAYTRAKKTWNPFRLGGFAETLVATSRVPVLLLNPSARPSSKISSILFPTEFSHESKNALLNLAPLAKNFDSQVLIYSQIENFPLYPMPISFNGTVPPMMDIASTLRQVEESRTKKAQRWVHLLEGQGIDCSHLIRRQRKNLSADILDIANKNKVNLIAMASLSGPVSQALLGGVARDLLLEAKCPVLIFHKTKVAKMRPATQKQFANKRTQGKKQSSLYSGHQHL
ncbi:MAG: universal stress protein [Pseudobdellovibrionaceae bacterium]